MHASERVGAAANRPLASSILRLAIRSASRHAAGGGDHDSDGLSPVGRESARCRRMHSLSSSQQRRRARAGSGARSVSMSRFVMRGDEDGLAD
jgi:hypothetical protein